MAGSIRGKLLLLLGFVALALGIGVAYLNPATGYELSIYRETPVPFWVLASFALVVSILIVFSTSKRRVRVLGTILGGLSMVTIVSLPLIRGYHYVGEADALSHLGAAKALDPGIMLATESRYPIVHFLGLILRDATGLELYHAMMILIVVFVVCFFIFVPLVVKQFTNHTLTVYIGLYSGFLLLPINHLAPGYRIHPTSQAILFAPAFLFVFFRLYKKRNTRHSLLFLPLAPMFVLLHPQQAANLLAFVGVVAVMQIGYDLLTGHGLAHRSGWVVPEVTYFGVVFGLWVGGLPVFEKNAARVIDTLQGGGQFASSTAVRSISLETVGGSLVEVFFKLFLVSVVFIVLTGLLFLLVVRRYVVSTSLPPIERVVPDGGTDGILLLSVFGGLVPVGVLFLLYLVGGISDQYFRHLGMLMVFATILGSITIGRALRWCSRHWSWSAARHSVVIVLILLTALSLPVVYVSPYMYDASNHVTEAQIHGYETTFENQADSIAFDDVRSPVFRYGHAIQSTVRPMEAYYYNENTTGIPDHFNNRSLRSLYVDPVYVPVTEADRIRDPVLWEGFRFNHEDFDYLDTEPGIHKVQGNGGYDLYLIEPSENPQNESSVNGA